MGRGWPHMILALACAGCGAEVEFRSAARLERVGEPLRAAAAWDAFLARRPGHARAPEAAYRSGALYARVLGRCAEAVPRFEAAARSSGPWSEPAKLGLMSCPEYFPLEAGRAWTYVDTLSGGENMRLEVRVVSSTGGAAGRVSGSFFAGSQRFREYSRRYEKADWTVWEEEAGARVPILRWPYRSGRSWTAQSARGAVTYSIESDAAAVRTKAGAYAGCLKVRARTACFESWTFDYYCPGVGRVKTTVGAPGVENPNTELASHK